MIVSNNLNANISLRRYCPYYHSTYHFILDYCFVVLKLVVRYPDKPVFSGQRKLSAREEV